MSGGSVDIGFGLFDDLQVLLDFRGEPRWDVALREFALPLLAEAIGPEFSGDVEELKKAVFAQGGGDEGVIRGVAV